MTSAVKPATGTVTATIAYVGSRTTRERKARGDGISVYQLDAATGALTRIQLVTGLVNPSFLAVAPKRQMLYAVHGDRYEISAFRIDPADGRLQFVNQQTTLGRNPVHLALDPDERHVVVSNHIGASLAVLPISADGALQPVRQLLTLDGPIGPHRVEQTQAKPHFNPFDPSGRFVLVPDKGLDRVFVYRFVYRYRADQADADGPLQATAQGWVASREGAGPRNLVFHPQRPLAYVVNELDSTVTSYQFEPDTGALTPLQVLSTLPPRCVGNSRAASIAVHPAGHTLYVSNRGDDSIAVFRLDTTTGLPSFIDAYTTGGQTPRFFTLSPCGGWLYALNEDSDTIVRFSVNPVTGLLSPQPQGDAVTACGSPVCMVFAAFD